MIYFFDPDTKYYLGIRDTSINPVTETNIAPPKCVGRRIPIWLGDSWGIYNITIEEQVISQRLADAWTAADSWGRSFMDDNSRLSITGLLIDPACPTWRKERISQFIAWWTSLWVYYATLKAQILAGQDVSFDSSQVGACPWSIWQIAASDQ